MPNADESARSGPPLLVSLFGRPGAGKTSVGDALTDCHGFVHLPLGRLLKQPAILAEIGIDPVVMGRAVASGRTITDEGLYPWLDAQILSQTAPVVVDGYPRVPSAIGPFNELAGRLAPKCEVIALHLDCPSEQAAHRIKRRGARASKIATTSTCECSFPYSRGSRRASERSK